MVLPQFPVGSFAAAHPSWFCAIVRKHELELAREVYSRRIAAGSRERKGTQHLDDLDLYPAHQTVLSAQNWR